MDFVGLVDFGMVGGLGWPVSSIQLGLERKAVCPPVGQVCLTNRGVLMIGDPQGGLASH